MNAKRRKSVNAEPRKTMVCAMMAAGFALLSLLPSCQSGMEQLTEAKDLNVLSPDGKVQTLPQLAEQHDGAVPILLPDTAVKYYPTNIFTLSDTILYPAYPHDILGSCRALQLGKVPDSQISQIDQVDSDDDLFFLLAYNKETGNKHREVGRVCLIFNSKGKCLAKVSPTEVIPGGREIRHHVQNMVVNRRTKEIRLVCGSVMPTVLYAYYYNYKGKFLRKEAIIPNSMKFHSFCDDWVVGVYRSTDTLPVASPQLLFYNEKEGEFRRALLKPQKDEIKSFSSTLATAPNGDLFYAANHSDTVWQVTPDALIARYVLYGPAVGAAETPYGKDSTYVSGTYFLSQKDRMCRSYLSPFLVSDDFMFLQYDKWKTLEWTNEERGSHGYSGQFIPIACILNRRTNHVRMIQTTPIRAEGLSSLLISRKPYCLTANNELVYVERVVSLKETAATYQDTNELTSSERRFIKQLPMDGNPVLFLLPLKPF